MIPAATAIEHGTLLTASGEVPDSLLVISGERIAYAGPWSAAAIPPGARRVDGAGLYVSPGFVDVHVHGGAGSDFMDADAQAAAQVFRYHALHGTTSFCPTTATAPLGEILACIDAIEAYTRAGSPWGRSLGVHVEGPYLAFTKRGCHLPDQVRNPREAEWKAILERGSIASMTLAPELEGARLLIEALHRGGATASAGHSEALFHEMEEAAAWGVRHVTHLYCAMTDSMNNRWRGTPNPRSAGIVEAVYLDDRFSSELITDGRHLSREMLLLALRNKGHEQLAIVTDAMRGAGMPDGEYTFGPRHGMRAVVRGGEARIPDGTALASSVLPMNAMVREFVRLTQVPLWKAVHMASLTPARIAGAAAATGSLQAGKLADVILLDAQLEVRGVWSLGRPLAEAFPDGGQASTMD